MKDDTGETRRERNIRFGFPEKNPEVQVPDGAEHLVEWFWDLSSMRASGWNGPNPIAAPDIAHWAAITGEIVTREEVAILRQMDAAYRAAVSDEMAAREKAREAANGR